MQFGPALEEPLLLVEHRFLLSIGYCTPTANRSQCCSFLTEHGQVLNFSVVEAEFLTVAPKFSECQTVSVRSAATSTVRFDENRGLLCSKFFARMVQEF